MKRLAIVSLLTLIAATVVFGAPYVPPKTYAPLDLVLSSDRNTENARLAAAINNIDPATQINDSSITSAQIAPGGISLNNLSANIAFVVVGTVTQYAGTSQSDTLTDAGWLMCTGAVASKATYPELWALIGTTYGPATGTTFTLPDFRGRVAIGANSGTISATVVEDTRSVRIVGDTGGVESHVLSETESVVYYGGVGTANGSTLTNILPHTALGHINMQPFLVVNYIVYAGRP
jgi:microcystin-dependent protein